MAFPSGDIVGVVSVGGENLTPSVVVLDNISDTTVIAAPASGRRIAVVAGVIGVSATSTVKLISGGAGGTVVWAGTISANNSPIVMPLSPTAWIVARDGESLYIDVSGTAVATGVLWYVAARSAYLNGA